MMTSPIPQNYSEWRHCITEECKIPLTQAFVAERLNIWRNGDNEETRRFRRQYGDDYYRAMLGWFEQAERELV